MAVCRRSLTLIDHSFSGKMAKRRRRCSSVCLFWMILCLIEVREEKRGWVFVFVFVVVVLFSFIIFFFEIN